MKKKERKKVKKKEEEEEKECYIYTTIGGLSSKNYEFLAGRPQFDSDHGVYFYAPTCCQSATFVRPLFAFYCLCFVRKK